MRLNNYYYYFIHIIYKLLIFLYRIPGIKFISNLPLLVNLKNYIKSNFFLIELTNYNFFKKTYLKQISNSQNNTQKNIFIEIYSLRPNSFGGVYRVTSEISKRFSSDLSLNKKYNIYYFIFEPLAFHFNILNLDFLLKKKKIIVNKKIFPKKNDIVLLLGNDIASISKYKKYFLFLSNQGVKFYTLIYDILPFLKPKWFDVPNYKKIFKKFILSLTFNDKILTISNKVKDDLNECFPKVFKKLRCETIKLGSDFKNVKKLLPIQKRNDNIIFFIVGTIEPRKNHIEIIKIFNKLFKDNNIELHIAGKLGWKYKKILSSIYNSIYFNKKIFFKENPTDDQLKNMYNMCDVIIVPSIDEGFGLPVIEGLQFKKLVIASDIKVFRELDQNNIFFFPIKKKIKEKLFFFQKFINDYQNKKIFLKKNKIYKWKNTYRELKKKLFIY